MESGDCPIVRTLLSERRRIAFKTFPLVLVLQLFQVFPSKIPPKALVAECLRTIVAKVDLPPFRAPPAVLIVPLPIFGPTTAAIAFVALCAHQHAQLGMPVQVSPILMVELLIAHGALQANSRKLVGTRCHRLNGFQLCRREPLEPGGVDGGHAVGVQSSWSCWSRCWFDGLALVGMTVGLLRLWLGLRLHSELSILDGDQVILAATPNHSSASLCSTFALLALVCVEQGEVVVVADLLARQDVPQGEESHPGKPTHRPLLHLAVGLTGMIDEPTLGARAVGVNHGLVVDGEAVVVVVRRVPAKHPLLKHLAAANLPCVLQDEAALADALPRPHPPTLLGSHEPLQPRSILPPLDGHVGATRTILANIHVTLIVGRPIDAARPASLLVLLLGSLAAALLSLVVLQQVHLQEIKSVSIEGDF